MDRLPGPREPAGLPIVVVCGLDHQRTARAAAELLEAGGPQLGLFVDPCSSGDGLVEISIRSDDEATARNELRDIGHSCASCALREAVVGILRQTAESGRYVRAVVHLHPAIEADVAVGALHRGIGRWGHLAQVVTVLDPDWYDGLTCAVTLAEAGIAAWDADERATSSLLAAGIEIADVLVLPGALPETPESAAVLFAMAPEARQIQHDAPLGPALPGTGVFEAGRVDVFHPYGLRDPHLELPPGPHGLSLLRWRTERPLHPDRLWDRLDDLAGGIVRSTGRLWFATRPDVVLGWDTAGDALRLGPVARWLLPAPDAAGSDVGVVASRAQRVHAARHVHPYYGDRENLVVLLGDQDAIAAAADLFAASVLRDDELALGTAAWRRKNDPFPLWVLPEHLFSAVSGVA